MELDVDALIENSEKIQVNIENDKVKDKQKQEVKIIDQPAEIKLNTQNIKERRQEIQNSENKIDKDIISEKINKNKNKGCDINIDLIVLFDFITNNKNKLSKDLSILDLDLSRCKTIRNKGHLLLVRYGSDTLQDGEIILWTNCDKIKIPKYENKNIEDINIFKSGIYIRVNDGIILITKNQINQFYLDSTNKVTKILDIKKSNNGSKCSIIDNKEQTLTDLNKFKELIKKFVPSYYKIIKDEKDMKLIKENLVSFVYDNIKDMSYMIKIFNNIFTVY